MNKLKHNKAITLVALIITIIVLLILAGVVISMTVGSDGIISKAQGAVDLYKAAVNEEQEIMYKSQNFINGDTVKLENENTANDIVKKIQQGESVLTYVGKEVEYITYKRADGVSTSNIWKIVYIGKNTDNEISAMNTEDNRIFIMPKYYVTSIAPSSQQITLTKNNNIVTVNPSNGGYSSRDSFKQDMRDSSKWSVFTKENSNSVAIGGPTLAQWNMINNWGGYLSMKAYSSDAQYTMDNLNFWWLSECNSTESNDIVSSNGNLQGSNSSSWTYTWGIRPLVMLASDDKVVFKNNNTADSIIKRIQQGESVSTFAGKEVEYITYKRADGVSTSNIWKIVYIGKNTDNEISAMNTEDNRIFIMPKYYVTSIAPSSQQITLTKNNNIVTVNPSNGGYSSRDSFKQDMRDSSKWSIFTKGNSSSVAIGGPTLAQWNMINNWGGYSSMEVDASDAQYTIQNLNFWWLSECNSTESNDIVSSNGNLQGSNSSSWTYTWGIRPLVMLDKNENLNFISDIDR